MKVTFDMKSAGQLMEEHGLAAGGLVQQFVDSECIRLMEPYTPMLNGDLCQSVTRGTDIGSGELVYASPYARYQYYGEVYGPNYPLYKDGVRIGFFSPPKKHRTGRDIEYTTSKHPKAGKLWFERMKSDHKEEILRGAAKLAGGKV